MIEPSAFEWDAVKAASNVSKHGVPFEVATLVFQDRHRVEIDVSRTKDSETRGKAVGMIENRLFVVVFTMRRSVCRIISARRTNAKEERAYADRS